MSAKKPSVSSTGIMKVKVTYNNVIVTCVNQKGEPVAWWSGGKSGTFKNSRKSTSEAAAVAGKKLGLEVKARGMSSISIEIRGQGQGREAVVRGLQESGIQIVLIKEVTGIAHNGCKPKKQTRK